MLSTLTTLTPNPYNNVSSNSFKFILCWFDPGLFECEGANKKGADACTAYGKNGKWADYDIVCKWDESYGGVCRVLANTPVFILEMSISMQFGHS